MPIIELRRKPRTKPESAYLRTFARNVTSQYGEDGIIAKIFEIIGTHTKWCVEFGAWDGRYLSNTWDLLNVKDWSGVLIEGDPDRAGRLAAEHKSKAGKIFIENAFIELGGASSLDAILSRTSAPRDIDLLSVDIDGNDWHIWKSLKQYRPRAVVIEFNPSASNQLYFVQDPDPRVNQGSSLLAFIDLGRDKGYELVATTYANAFFVTDEDFKKFGIIDNSIDAIYEEYMTTEICQGFDGTIFAAGHMHLTWHDIPLAQEDFQVLPKVMRKYPDPGERV